MAKSRVCGATVISKIHSESAIQSIRSALAKAGSKFNVDDLGVFREPYDLREALKDCGAVAILVGTGGTERIIFGGLKNYRGGVLLVSYPGNNSLAAAVEVYAALREAGVNPALYHYRDKSKLEHPFRALKAVASFKSSRIGLFGETEPWLIYSGVSREDVAKVGPSVIRIPLSRLYEEYQSVEVEEARRLAKAYRVRTSSKISNQQLENVARLYLAIDNIVRKDELDAYTIQCFEVIRVLHVTPCFSLAKHNSEGIVAGCEGDLSSLAGMMISYYSTGVPAFMGNIVDIEDSKVLFAHCTGPLNIGNYHITTHFETGYPAGVSVVYPSGRPATIVKMLLRHRRMIIARATIRASTPRPNTCRTQIMARLEGDTGWMIDDDVGNHYVIVTGDHVETLSLAGRILGFKVEVH